MSQESHSSAQSLEEEEELQVAIQLSLMEHQGDATADALTVRSLRRSVKERQKRESREVVARAAEQRRQQYARRGTASAAATPPTVRRARAVAHDGANDGRAAKRRSTCIVLSDDDDDCARTAADEQQARAGAGFDDAVASSALGARTAALAADHGSSDGVVHAGTGLLGMLVSPPRPTEHPTFGKQMCIAGDATQLRPRTGSSDASSFAKIATDGEWYCADPKQITVALDETHRYGKDVLMAQGMHALSWGDTADPSWVQLKAKLTTNRLNDLKSTHILGTNEGAMHKWYDEIAWLHANAAGATRANNKVFVWEDRQARQYEDAPLAVLRSGGYEKNVFIMGCHSYMQAAIRLMCKKRRRSL